MTNVGRTARSVDDNRNSPARFDEKPKDGSVCSQLSVELTPHNVNGQDAALMAGKKIIDEIADDRVRFVPKLRHHTANQGAAPAVPFQIDGAVQISRAMDFRPAVRSA